MRKTIQAKRVAESQIQRLQDIEHKIGHSEEEKILFRVENCAHDKIIIDDSELKFLNQMTQQFEKNGISSKRFDKIEKFYEDVKRIKKNLLIYPGECEQVVSIEVASKVKQKMQE